MAAAPVTRFAPAPTGHLHLGHVANALWVWGAAGALGGRVLVRIEDHDRVRAREAFERSILADLDWLGFAIEAPLVRQSERGEHYAAALERLRAAGLLYACACTRREIAAAGAPGAAELRYPGTCDARSVPFEASPMRRVRLAPRAIGFRDLLAGEQRQTPAEQCGDLLAIDRDGNWTYQFAVVVDDFEQGVDLVVRGQDLLASTGRQIQLAALLGRRVPPRFLHHPLIRRADGAKLSKSEGDAGVGELRSAGWSRERVLGAAAAAVGLVERPRALAALDAAELVAATGALVEGAPARPNGGDKLPAAGDGDDR